MVAYAKQSILVSANKELTCESSAGLGWRSSKFHGPTNKIDSQRTIYQFESQIFFFFKFLSLSPFSYLAGNHGNQTQVSKQSEIVHLLQLEAKLLRSCWVVHLVEHEEALQK